MKKLKLNLAESGKEMLSREQMKKVLGGDYGSGGGEKCCWNNDPSNCSTCTQGANSSWTCSAGSTLTKC